MALGLCGITVYTCSAASPQDDGFASRPPEARALPSPPRKRLGFLACLCVLPCDFFTRPLRSTVAFDVCLSADSVAVRCIPARAQTLSAIQGDSCLPRVHCALRGDVGGAGASRRSRSDLTASTNRVASVRSPDHGPTDSARPSAVSPQPAMSAAMPAPINHVLTLDDRLVFPFSPSLAIGPWYLGA